MQKKIILGFQHMFAAFSATILVGILCGIPIQNVLLAAGLGTLLFHAITGGNIPMFLGSSFAYISTMQLIAASSGYGAIYGATICIGLIYVAAALLIKYIGIDRFLNIFPVEVRAPIVILIGLTLAPTATQSITTNMPLALITFALLIGLTAYAKGLLKISAILVALVISTIIGIPFGWTSFEALKGSALIGLPKWIAPTFNANAIVLMCIVAFSTICEHISDVATLSSICGENYMAQLPRTLCGDGLATSLAGLLNAPSNTSYGENCGVIALTGIKDPSVVRIAAIIMIVLGFSPWFSQLVLSIPTAAIGAVSFLMYGMISASGLKNLVENKVNFSDTRTLVIIAMILVSGLGFSTYPLIFNLGTHVISVSGIAIATLVGILLNIIWKKKA